jgi:hypothetical protein
MGLCNANAIYLHIPYPLPLTPFLISKEIPSPLEVALGVWGATAIAALGASGLGSGVVFGSAAGDPAGDEERPKIVE